MARERGTFDFSANFEVKKEGSIDARQLVDDFSDLLNFTSDDYIPKGFTVSVKDPTTIGGVLYDSGLYMCVDPDNLNIPSSWEPVGKSQSLSDSLKEGNISDGEDIIISDGDSLKFSSSLNSKELDISVKTLSDDRTVEIPDKAGELMIDDGTFKMYLSFIGNLTFQMFAPFAIQIMSSSSYNSLAHTITAAGSPYSYGDDIAEGTLVEITTTNDDLITLDCEKS